MNWWQLLILWLGGWVFIILLDVLNHIIKKDDTCTKYVSDELLADANNLFLTGIFYFAGNIVCMLFSSAILHWILFIAGIAFCVLPMISLIKNLFELFTYRPKVVISFIGSVVGQTIPLVMAINIFIVNLS